MADTRLLQLVLRLKELTDKGKVDWEETVEEDAFQAAFPEYVVKIRNHRYMTLPDDISVQIFNGNGVMVESATGRELEGVASNSTGLRELMNTLYESARRKALGGEKAVSDLLSYFDTLSAR